MSSMSISIPDSLRERVESLAREDGVSPEAFVATVLSQRVAVADADSYIRHRAARGGAHQMLDILSQAPKVEPESFDRL
jgi:predicted transcriptional regulator